MWTMLKSLIMNYKVPITAFEAVLEDIDVDDDGCVNIRELILYLKMWFVR